MKSLSTCSSVRPRWSTSPVAVRCRRSTLPILRKDWAMNMPARLILRTGWSEYFGNMKFYNEYPFLSENAAQWLVENGVRLIAMDTPSPDNPAHSRGTPKDSPNHKVLLGAGVVLVEYLANLKALTAVGSGTHRDAFEAEGLRRFARTLRGHRKMKEKVKEKIKVRVENRS